MRTLKNAKGVQANPKRPNPNNKLKITTEDPELAGRFNRVLGATVKALEDTGIRYAFIGGIASGGLGRPRSTHDIDLFVMPEDAELTLRALFKGGFETEKTDPSWLYKGFKEDILVDVIFKSKGEIYLDSEMYGRTITAEFHGRSLRLVAPEDLLIIKAAAHSELTPNHWHDATALLSHASLDWPYLIKRARRAPRRILSLLLYAQSNDIWVPNSVIHELFEGIFGDVSRNINGSVAQSKQLSGVMQGVQQMPRASRGPLVTVQQASLRGGAEAFFVDSNGSALSTERSGAAASFEPRGGAAASTMQLGHHLKTHQEYAVSHLRECLAEDPRTNELDILIDHSGNKILLRGEVAAEDRREAVGQIARECFPDAVIENQLRILNFQEPAEAEEVQ